MSGFLGTGNRFERKKIVYNGCGSAMEHKEEHTAMVYRMTPIPGTPAGDSIYCWNWAHNNAQPTTPYRISLPT